MRTDQQRGEKYVAKYQATTVSLKVAAMLAGMKTGFSNAIDSLVPIEMQVQGLLNGTTPAVPTVQYAFYYNFAREIWKLQNQGIDGDALEAMAQSLHDKYVAYGLTTAVLIAIADSVFNITVS
jgi:hypothetical protein